MKNSLNKCIFLNILFLMGVVATVDIYAAKPNSKRASRSKSSTPSRKKTIPSSSENTDSTVVESGDSRAVSGTTTSRPGRTNTVSATSSSAVDDNTASELLATNLLACLQYPCNGDVAYEKCFANGMPESYVRSNTTCLGMYNGAANDIIRVKAMNQVNTKIKSYFSDACEAAGGKISGSTCKIKVCYQAKGGSHSSPTKCMDYNVGKQVTCSYTAFGLGQQDLEYKEDMNSEQIGTIVQAGMQALNGLLETGVAIADTVQASKQLKNSSTVKGKDCYGVYNYKDQKITMSEAWCVKKWEKCPGGKQKGCEGKETDSAGNYYKVYSTCTMKDSNGNYVECNIEGAKTNAKGNKDIQECSLAKTKKNIEENGCLVKFDTWTDVAVQEQEASLYKKFTDFKTLQIRDQLSTAYVQATTYESIYGSSNNTEKDWCEFPATSTSYPTNSLCLSKSIEESSCQNLKNKTCEVLGSDRDKDKIYSFGCRCKAGSSSGSILNPSSNKIKDRIKEIDNGIENGTENIDFSTNNYDSAVETFNSMQKKVNEEKQKITTLEEKKNKGLQTAISSGAQTLTTAGSSLTMALVSANSNISTMTGACYIGDPKSGGIYFMSENEVKKLSWKNL